MSEKNTIRLFFAIDFTEKMAGLLANFTNELKQHYRDDSIRWVHPSHYHVTLQFLPAVHIADLNNLTKNARDVIRHFHTFELQLENLELFPTPSHPRVISLCMSPHEFLSNLSSQLGQVIMATGYEIEKRAFRAHLTLGKLKKNNIIFEKMMSPALPVQTIHEIVLYQSHPDFQGSHYTKLATFPLSK